MGAFIVPLISVFQEFCGSINKNFVLAFRNFPDISYFLKMLSLKSLRNSWGNVYIPCLQVMVAYRFTELSEGETCPDFLQAKIEWQPTFPTGSLVI